MPTFETAAERRARLHEQAGRAHRSAAKRVLDDLGWSANAREVGDEVRRRFRRLTEAGVTMVVSEARRMQQDPRLRTEAMVQRSETTKATRKALRKLLTERPELTASEAWHRLQEAGVDLCARSSFEKIHMPEIRKELGIDPKVAMSRAAEVRAAASEATPQRYDTVSDHSAKHSEAPAPAIVCVDPAQESPKPFVDRLLDEIRQTEDRLRRLRVALEVAEEIEGERAA